MIPAWINTEEYPFIPKKFAQPMGTMRYVDEGRGDPFVMVHGNPSWSFEFRALIKHFAQTHRCIAPDRIGFGLSDKPADWTYLRQQHAENLERLLESLNLHNITLICDDWGGPIALSYAIKHPEKVKNIIVTNTWLWPVNDDWYYRAFSGFMGGANRPLVDSPLQLFCLVGGESGLRRQKQADPRGAPPFSTGAAGGTAQGQLPFPSRSLARPIGWLGCGTSGRSWTAR